MEVGWCRGVFRWCFRPARNPHLLQHSFKNVLFLLGVVTPFCLPPHFTYCPVFNNSASLKWKRGIKHASLFFRYMMRSTEEGRARRTMWIIVKRSFLSDFQWFVFITAFFWKSNTEILETDIFGFNIRAYRPIGLLVWFFVFFLTTSSLWFRWPFTLRNHDYYCWKACYNENNSKNCISMWEFKWAVICSCPDNTMKQQKRCTYAVVLCYS